MGGMLYDNKIQPELIKFVFVAFISLVLYLKIKNCIQNLYTVLSCLIKQGERDVAPW